MPTIFSGTNDGHIATDLFDTFKKARSQVAGGSISSTLTRYASAVFIYAATGRGGPVNGIVRSFFEFDTSGISSAPSSASIFLLGYSNNGADVILVKSNQSTTLALDDFDAIVNGAAPLGNSDGSGAGTFAGTSVVTYSAEIATWSTSGYNEIELNSAALSDIASEDTFKVCFMEYDHDYLDIDPGSSAVIRSGLYYADAVGTSTDPYLDYTVAAAAVDDAVFFGTNF